MALPSPPTSSPTNHTRRSVARRAGAASFSAAPDAHPGQDEQWHCDHDDDDYRPHPREPSSPGTSRTQRNAPSEEPLTSSPAGKDGREGHLATQQTARMGSYPGAIARHRPGARMAALGSGSPRAPQSRGAGPRDTRNRLCRRTPSRAREAQGHAESAVPADAEPCSRRPGTRGMACRRGCGCVQRRVQSACNS